MALEPSTTHDRNGDLPAHVRDYSRFMRMLKIGAIASFIIAMVVLVIISK